MVVVERSKVNLRWTHIEDAIDQLASLLKTHYMPMSLYAMPRGGVVIAGILSYKLRVYHSVPPPIIHVIRKSGWIYTSEANPTWSGKLVMDYYSPQPLIVEDIVDTGNTLARLRQNFPTVPIATLFTRESHAQEVDYYGQIVTDPRWLVFPWAPDDEPPAG